MEESEQKPEDKQCPYGAGECPKIKTVRDYVRQVDNKLTLLLILFVATHGIEAITYLQDKVMM